MNKPEKKKLLPCHSMIHVSDQGIISLQNHNIGYNSACDEWDRYHEEDINILNRRIMDLTNRLITLPTEEEIARTMHDVYEKQAKIIGWKTQKSCQVKFDDLPKANKKVMYAVAKAIHKRIKGG